MKTTRYSAVILSAFLLSPVVLLAQDDEPPFPKPGSIMPQSFAPLNLNRIDLEKLYAKSEDNDTKPDLTARRRCLLCEVGVKPFVMVFARKPAKNDALLAFMDEMEKAIGRNVDFYLNGAVVFVDAGAQSSLENPDEKEPEKLIREASNRIAFNKWLGETVGPWIDPKVNKDKKVYVAIYPEPGPAKFQLDPKAEVTVFFSRKHRLIQRWQFGAGMFNNEAANEIIAAVEKYLADSK